MIRITNIVKTVQSIQSQLLYLIQKTPHRTVDVKHKEWQSIYAKMRSTVDKIDKLCAQNDVSVAHLPTPSRRAYHWMRFLSELEAEDNWRLTQHIETLTYTYHAIQKNLAVAFQKQTGLWKKKVDVQIDLSIYYSNSLYRTKYTTPLLNIVFHEGFIGAPPKVIDALINIFLNIQTEAQKKQVQAYIKTSSFQELARSLNGGSAEVRAAPTREDNYYNLDEVFARVNQAYFNNHIKVPHLIWSKRLTRRKYGHYQPNEDILLISRTLDAPSIPTYFIDFIMYHELLHKALGAKVVNGKRYSHTPEFRQAEKQYKEYPQAQEYMKQLTQKLNKKIPKKKPRRRH